MEDIILAIWLEAAHHVAIDVLGRKDLPRPVTYRAFMRSESYQDFVLMISVELGYHDMANPKPVYMSSRPRSPLDRLMYGSG